EAFVYNIFPSAEHPFKIASQLGVVGELSSDRFYAIGGTIGVKPPTVPAVIEVFDADRHVHKTLHLQVVQHKYLTAALLAAAATDAISSTAATMGDSTAKIAFDVEAHGCPPLHFSTVETSPTIDGSIETAVGRSLARVSLNEFEPAPLTRVHLRIDVSPGRQAAVIERVFTDRARYQPGDTMQVGVLIKPYDKPAVVRSVKVRLPLDADKGALKIGVSGGNEVAVLRKRLLIREPKASSLPDLLQLIQDSEQSNDLVVSVVFGSSGAMIGSANYSFLPLSLREVLPTLTNSAIGAEKDQLEQRQETPWVLQGSEVVSVDVTPNLADPAPPHPVMPTLLALDTGLPLSVKPAASKPTPSPSASPITLPTPAATPSSSSGPDTKVLPSGARRWDLDSVSSLGRGDLHDVALCDDGSLALAPAPQVEAKMPGRIIWGMARHGSKIALACGPPAAVETWSGGDRHEYSLRATTVNCVLVADDGTILAGTAPHGRLFAIAPNGAVHTVASTHARYVWSLAAGPDGDVYVGTGLPGNVYRVHHGEATRVCETGESHVRCLAVAADGTIYAGTANRGIVYRIRGSQMEPIFTSSYASVDALLMDGDDLMIGSGATVYRLSPAGVVTRDNLPNRPVFALTHGADGAIYAGTDDARVFRLKKNEPTRLVWDDHCGPVVGLLQDGNDLLAARAAPAGLMRLGNQARQGEYDSPVLDASMPAWWGALRWTQDGQVTVQTRSGNTPAPDGTWSTWVADRPDATIASPSARYLQLRVLLSGASPDVGPLQVYYRLRPQTPRLVLLAPGNEDEWSGKEKIRWKAEDVDRETLAYDLDYSPDGGHTWKPIRSDLRAATREKGLKPAGKKGVVPEDSYEWDTSKLPEGNYLVRVTARDLSAASAPVGSVESRAVCITNHRPELKVRATTVKDGRIRVTGLATSSRAPIVEVSYRLDGGDWHSALAADGLFDSTREEFFLEEGYEKKPTFIEIRVSDEAGNTMTEKHSL
ncbi:MAG: hypothetical protein ACYCW6_06955, partial [Candidatus Xenobia bacterium]